MPKKTIKMKCGEVEKDLPLAHAEKIISNPKSSKDWKIVDKDYKVKDGKIISTASTGADKGTKKQGGDK